jgi:hypothetical protein
MTPLPTRNVRPSRRPAPCACVSPSPCSVSARQCCRLGIWRLAGSAVPHRLRRARGVPREGRPVRLQAARTRSGHPRRARQSVPERRASQAYAPSDLSPRRFRFSGSGSALVASRGASKRRLGRTLTGCRIAPRRGDGDGEYGDRAGHLGSPPVWVCGFSRDRHVSGSRCVARCGSPRRRPARLRSPGRGCSSA